ncbi:peptidoglycan DD-metalloendopeptidase family protein [Reichenbachiella sp. MALMAid0571]|uniref:murein hydrolase activator EnvC family protein n=1 Tax=Reichenbachiella sp. MALMAid0571 TaxID=3143939 RepID=UPI0032DE5854
MLKNRKCTFTLVLFLLFVSSISFAQKSKSRLEKEKKENLLKIQEAEKILVETTTEKKATLGQLRALNRKIQLQGEFINSISQEISFLNAEISDKSLVVNALQNDLKNLKEEYAEMIYSAYKANHGFSKLTFIFSAKTFNQLFLRLKYLEQYSEARKIQVQNIEEVSDALSQEKTGLENKKAEQSDLLKSKIQENKNLLSLKSRQNKVFTQLSKQEKELRAELAKRKEAISRLDKLIAEIVKSEIEKSNVGKSSTKMTLTPETAKLSSSFEENKNKLPWPVEHGFVSGKFGKHAHPVLKNIIVENQGVDIQTEKAANVRAVFDGKVSTVAFVPGMNAIVIVQHGDYFTVYGRLKNINPNIKKGYMLKAKEQIGEVVTDNNDNTEVHFEVWKNRDRLNPEKWLFVK